MNVYPRGFWLINLSNFLDGMCYFGILAPLTLFLEHRLGMNDVGAGWVVSIYTGLVTLFMVSGGMICDRKGARGALREAFAWLLIGRVMLLFAPHWSVAALALLVMSYGTGIVQPAVYAGVKETVAPQQLGMGFAILFGIMNAGVVLWNLVAPTLRAQFDVAGVYAILAGVTLFNLLVQWSVPLDAPAQREDTPERPTATLVDRNFLIFIFLLIPVRMLVAHLWLTLPLVLERAYPHSVAARLEWCIGLNSLILAVGTPLLNRFTRGIQLNRLMVSGTAVSALSVFLLCLPPAAGPLIAYLVLFSLGEAVWAARFYEWVAGAALPGRLGAAMGLANVPWFLAKTGAGMYSGWMLATFVPAVGPPRPELLWAIYGAIALITPIGLALHGNRR